MRGTILPIVSTLWSIMIFTDLQSAAKTAVNAPLLTTKVAAQPTATTLVAAKPIATNSVVTTPIAAKTVAASSNATKPVATTSVAVAKTTPAVSSAQTAQAAKAAAIAKAKALQAANAAAQAKKFAALQQTPAYKSAMGIVQDKNMQTVYKNGLNSINTFFTQYSAQVLASTGHGRVPSTSGINGAMTALAGSQKTFTMQTQQAALDTVFQDIVVPIMPATSTPAVSTPAIQKA